jgi:hypothetical protein
MPSSSARPEVDDWHLEQRRHRTYRRVVKRARRNSYRVNGPATTAPATTALQRIPRPGMVSSVDVIY